MSHSIRIRAEGDVNRGFTNVRDVVVFGPGLDLQARLKAVAMMDLVRVLRHRIVQVDEAEAELMLLEEETIEQELNIGAWA